MRFFFKKFRVAYKYLYINFPKVQGGGKSSPRGRILPLPPPPHLNVAK